MQVILTEDVVGLGDIGESVKVKPGYARNFLIPRGKAIESQTSNAKVTKHLMTQIEARKGKLKDAAQEQATKLSETALKLGLRVGSGGKVFGSITSRDISKALAEEGFELDRRRILLDEPIKQIGSKAIKVKLHADVFTEIKVEIEQLQATKEQEAEETERARAEIEAAAALEVARRVEEARATSDEDESQKAIRELIGGESPE
jgi:large subunit ribosomal protein L9